MPELTYNQLQAAVTAMTKKIARSSEAIRQDTRLIDREAQATRRDAEAIASLRVDKASVGECHELSKIIAGLSEAVIEHAAAADNTAKRAQAVHTQNQDSHSGIKEAVNRSPVGQEIYGVNRQWVTPA